MVTVAQLVEHQVVALVVAGSSPVSHPMAPYQSGLMAGPAKPSFIGSNPIGAFLKQ